MGQALLRPTGRDRNDLLYRQEKEKRQIKKPLRVNYGTALITKVCSFRSVPAAAQEQGSSAQQAQCCRSGFRNLRQGKVIKGCKAVPLASIPLNRKGKRPVFPYHDILYRSIKPFIGSSAGSGSVRRSKDSGIITRHGRNFGPVPVGVCTEALSRRHWKHRRFRSSRFDRQIHPCL